MLVQDHASCKEPNPRPKDIDCQRTIEWRELLNVQFLQNGTGTSLFTADLCGQRVVIKAPLSGMSDAETKEVIKELRKEVSIISTMDHPGIICLIGTGLMPMNDGSRFFFFVAEFLQGGTLYRRLHSKARPKSKNPISSLLGTKRNAMQRNSLYRIAEQAETEVPEISFAEALRIAEDLADALRYIHDESDASHVILHRDLKPDNVGFRSDGSVCLFDFGLSTMSPRSGEDQAIDKRLHVPSRRRDSADGTSSGAHGSSAASSETYYLPRYRMTGNTGTTRYMAPEVALELPYNQSVDVYSFSIILWEMISRTKPYAGMNVHMHRARVCENGERPLLDARVFREDLASCIRAGWAHDMDARPSFAEIVSLLSSVRAKEAIAKRRVPSIGFSAGFLRRSKFP